MDDPLFTWTADVDHIDNIDERKDKLYKNNRWCFGWLVVNRSQGVAIGKIMIS